MSTINLNPSGLIDWHLYTMPNERGELELCVEDDERDKHWAFLSIPQMLRLRDVLDSAMSQCLCSYIVERAICDEYDKYTLTEPHPECPFHGEKN